LRPAQNQEVSGKWRMYEWSADRRLYWGAILGAVTCFLFMNVLFYYNYAYFDELIIPSSNGLSRHVDIEDATILDYGLWYTEIILFNITGIILIFAAIIIKHRLSKKFYIGSELWTERFTPLKIVEEKVVEVLCHFLDHNQVLYNLNRSDSAILIEGKNIHIGYNITKEKDVRVSITPIKPHSIFAKPEKYIMPQDILYIIDIIEKAMVTDNFLQQPVQRPLVTLIR